MTKSARKLPRCYKCLQAIRASEYLDDGTKQRHIVCPAPRGFFGVPPVTPKKNR